MTKNIYYRTVLRRHNAIKDFILDFFLFFCSGPRLLLEVFIREGFGERYFSYSSAIIIAIYLAFLPLPLLDGAVFIYHLYSSVALLEFFIVHLLSWYIFLGLFLYVCRKHRKALKRNPSTFDFARFSLSAGYLKPYFAKLLGNRFDLRKREIVVEPLAFFIAGLFLMIIGQWVGLLIISASVFYSLGWWGAYHKTDNFTLDKIDEMITNEQLVDVFVHNASPDKTKGVQWYGRRPASETLRRKLAETFMSTDEEEDVAFVQ